MRTAALTLPSSPVWPFFTTLWWRASPLGPSHCISTIARRSRSGSCAKNGHSRAPYTDHSAALATLCTRRQTVLLSCFARCSVNTHRSTFLSTATDPIRTFALTASQGRGPYRWSDCRSPQNCSGRFHWGTSPLRSPSKATGSSTLKRARLSRTRASCVGLCQGFIAPGACVVCASAAGSTVPIVGAMSAVAVPPLVKTALPSAIAARAKSRKDMTAGFREVQWLLFVALL